MRLILLLLILALPAQANSVYTEWRNIERAALVRLVNDTDWDYWCWVEGEWLYQQVYIQAHSTSQWIAYGRPNTLHRWGC
jgi:hypothetical protein